MNFLIPIDFSSNSIQAANFAFEHYPNASFHILHIVNVRQAGATLVIDINEEIKKANEKKMAKLELEINNTYPNHDLKFKVEIGLFSETIIEEIETTKADIIVLGTKGASGIDEILLGSNAYLAIKNSTIPLIIIPENYGLKAPTKVLIASDFEGNLSDKSVKPIIDFKEKFKAEIHVLHVADSEESDSVKLKINHLIDDMVDRFHIVEDDNIEDAISLYMTENDFDFLVLAPKYRGIIRNLFHQSVTKKISAKAKSPLFIIK